MTSGFEKWTIAASTRWRQDGAVVVRSAEEVIKNWKPGQHLYVKDDLGISKQQLAKLEQWLDKNGPHWTVVLMRQASDETYHTQDKRTFHGMDAVEFALGHGLANRTDFGGLVRKATGETDGAVFVLFLVERKFSYYGSDVHDRRGLGESKWIGDLDREAVRAMRNGGRIVDAVKNTVNSINTRLEKKIEAEKKAEEQAKIAAERARLVRRRELDFLGVKLDESRDEMLPRVETSARQIRIAFPDAAESELVEPPIDLWKKGLEDLQKDLANIQVDEASPYQRSPEFRKLLQATNQLRGEIDYYLDLYAAHKSFGEMMSPVEQRVDQVADHPSGAAIETSDEAYRILADARSGHARGEVSFVDQIRRASELAEQGEQAIRLEQQRIKAEEERAKLIRRTLTIVASVLAAALLGILWLLNLRRRPALQRAHHAFDLRSKAVGLELEKIEPILNRVKQVIGNENGFSRKGFTGQTLELGNLALANVQLLAEMKKEVRSVVAVAQQLLYPSNPLAEAANMVSASRYEHCSRLLSGDSLRASGMASDAKGKSKISDSAWQSFEGFFENLRRIANETEKRIDTIDDGLTNVDSQVEELQAKISTAITLEDELSRASKLDRYFRVPSFFNNLLPQAQQDYDRASELASNDPVEAMAKHVPEGLRKISDGIAVAIAIQRGRSEIFPQLDQASDELRSKGYDIRWIEQNVFQLGDRADQLMVDATNQPIEAESQSFDDQVTRLGLRAKRCVELADGISENVAPALDRLQAEIVEARENISVGLGVGESRVLHELNYDPDVELEQARKQLQSARAALDYGGVPSARESLEVLDIESETARNLLEDSLAAVKDFTRDHAQRSTQQKTLSDQLTEVRALISDRQSRYADSAMRLRTVFEMTDEELVAGGETIISLAARSEEILNNVADSNTQAKKIHFDGGVLQAANLLQLIQSDLDATTSMLDEASDHCVWLDKQALENESDLRRQLASANALDTTVNDLRTQQRSLDLFDELKMETAEFQNKLENTPMGRDPFVDQQRIGELATQAIELTAFIDADRGAHAEAARAVEGAELESKTANQSVLRSLNDRIPDSTTIKNCQDQVASLATQLGDVQNRIQVAHENWHDVGQQAERITAELALIDGQLRRELELAQDAVGALQSASARVFEAAGWRGSYGIRVVANPGSQELSHARQRLAGGEYQAAIDYSHSAAFHAKRALDIARRQVREEKQKIARNAAAARRRRKSAFSLGSLSSGKSFGSRSGGSSWSGSSRSWGGSSRSSSGGSGFSRSGW